jgi:putative salt-induced outer membrane protein YdiY
MRKLAASLLALVPFLSADQVVLKNGDTLTGNIIKKDGGKLTIKSEFLGVVSMPWTAVQSVKSDEPLTVVLPGGETVSGKVSTADGRLEVASKSAALAEVGDMRNPAEQRSWERIQHPGLLELWTGFVDLGLALARGNARTDTLTTGMNATRVTRHDKLALSFSQIYGTARINGLTGTIASAVRGGWLYNRDFTGRAFINTFNDYEHDRFQKLDLRFVLGAGAGINARKTEKAVVSFAAGGAYSRENFTNDLHRNSAELYFGDDVLYKLSPVTSVTQSFRMFPNLTNTGEYRMNFDLAGVTAIKRWLGWHLTASERYLSNPVLGRQRNDLILSTGFRLSFAK